MLHPREVLRSQTPSDIRASPNHPGVRAGNIHQDGVECFRLERRGVLQPIDRNNGEIADAEPDQILLQAGQADLVIVTGHQTPLIFHFLRQVPALPPGAAHASRTTSPGFGSNKSQATRVLGSWT